MLWTSFLRFFAEQDYDVLLGIGVAAAAVYSVVVAVGARLLGRRGADRILVAASLALVLFVGGLVLYDSIVHYHRTVPGGSFGERRGESFERWVDLARIGFFAYYAASVAAAGAIGYAFGGRRSAAVVAASTVGFMLVTAWFVDALNTCDVGYGFGSFSC